MKEHGDNWLFHFYEVMNKEDKSFKKPGKKGGSTAGNSMGVSPKNSLQANKKEGSSTAILIPLSGSIDIADLKKPAASAHNELKNATNDKDDKVFDTDSLEFLLRV